MVIPKFSIARMLESQWRVISHTRLTLNEMFITATFMNRNFCAGKEGPPQCRRKGNKARKIRKLREEAQRLVIS